MFACRITGNNDGQEFVRMYYETVQMDRNEFRGAAKFDHLLEQIPADAFVSVYINDKGVTLVRATGKEAPVELMKFTDVGQSGHFQVGDLDFEARIIEWHDSEKATLNVDNIMSRFYAGISLRMSERECLTCGVKNPNWLAILQDCLEDGKVDMDNFTAIDTERGRGMFVCIRGRLRLSHYSNCVNGELIRELLAELKKRS